MDVKREVGVLVVSVKRVRPGGELEAGVHSWGQEDVRPGGG